MDTKQPWVWEGVPLNCSTCVFWVQPEYVRAHCKTYGGDPSESFGNCQRHSPTVNGWPQTFGPNACGDHKLSDEDTNKAVEAAGERRRAGAQGG